MTKWLGGLVLAPFLVCGAMCIGGGVLKALGLRRSSARADRGCCRDPSVPMPTETDLDPV